MHLKSILLSGLAVLTSSVIADHLVTVEGCDADLFRMCGYHYAHWHIGYSVYEIDAEEGCRDPSVPGMTWICVDYGNERGEFKYEGGPKRCFTRTSTTRITDDSCWAIECWRKVWEEAPCTW
ncbi:hypothetical protein FQN54_002102 [Arachnomyces sp. PD_36]|nr:hypothetical protein FQN54_002102 [Arachnomyces sp. PD_36]